TSSPTRCPNSPIRFLKNFLGIFIASLTISLSIYSFPCPGSWYRLQSQWKILAFASSVVISLCPLLGAPSRAVLFLLLLFFRLPLQLSYCFQVATPWLVLPSVPPRDVGRCRAEHSKRHI